MLYPNEEKRPRVMTRHIGVVEETCAGVHRTRRGMLFASALVIGARSRAAKFDRTEKDMGNPGHFIVRVSSNSALL